MKRWICACLMMLMLFPAFARADFVEGRSYMVVPFPTKVVTGKKVEVREFFWYGCPHCYVLEPALTRWLQKLPANAEFVRTPGLAAPGWQLDGQAYYTFKALGVEEKLHRDFFKAAQEQRGTMVSPEAVADFAASHGIDRKKFMDTFNSFSVHLDLEKAKQYNADLNINSVPTFVVDGRYLTSPAMAEGEDKFFKLLDYLIEKAAKQRKTKAVKH
ncbi:MAG: thiol:disulfide interchange protein DsbA/DsbL [Sulfuricaulis sp.]